MDEFPKVMDSGGWSREENKLFELALAVVDENSPYRWQTVAAMIKGRSAEEVEKQYVILLDDLRVIESGELDHKLGEWQSCLKFEYSCSLCWTDEDHNLLFQLDIN